MMKLVLFHMERVKEKKQINFLVSDRKE